MADGSNLPATRKSVTAEVAERYGMDTEAFERTVRATCSPKDVTLTKEQFAACMVVAREYNLNILTREIFFFPSKGGGVIPVVSVDGWAHIINENPALNGIEFKYSEISATMPGGKSCPEWCEVILHRKDRQHPTIVREYLDEVYREATKGPGPWQTHTKRFLRHKTLIQGSRIAFGFAGIYDQDEAERIIEAEATVIESEPGVVEMNASQAKRGGLDKWITDTLLGAQTPADIDAMFEDFRWKCVPPSWHANFQEMIDFHKARVSAPDAPAFPVVEERIASARTSEYLIEIQSSEPYQRLNDQERETADALVLDKAMEIASA